MDEYSCLLNGTLLVSGWRTIENMNETLMQHQGIINVFDIQCRIDASLMLMMTTLMYHQC